MIMRKSIYVLAVIFFLSMTVSIAASAAVVKSIGSGVDPAIDGSKITWARTNGNELYLYDLATAKTSKITTSLSCYPDIDVSSNTLVWCENIKGPRLAVYNMGTKKARYIPLSEKWVRSSISNGKIVWSTKGSINMYDVSTGQQAFVANGYNPDISGNKIAYEAVDTEGGHYIVIYDIVSKDIATVSRDGDLTKPKISGDYVIYDYMGNLAQYNVATGENKVLNENNIAGHSDEGELYDYALQGPVSVYAKSHDSMMGLAGVYVYDSGTEDFQWIRATGDKTGVTIDISGDSTGMNIVWGFVPDSESSKKVNGGIYLTPYVQAETGPLDINTWRDGAKANIYGSDGRFIVSASGSTMHENLPFGGYTVTLSGMGEPATRSMSFNMTGEGVYMDFPV